MVDIDQTCSVVPQKHSSDQTDNDPDLSTPEVLIDSGASKEEPKTGAISPIPGPSFVISEKCKDPCMPCLRTQPCKECKECALKNARECVALICRLKS